MKNLTIAALFLASIFAFTPIEGKVKMIDDAKLISEILKTEQVVINRISCELKDGSLCPLEIDQKEISVNCSCEEGELILEPKIKLLGEWDQKESETVVKYAHEYFKNNDFKISEIVFLKSKEQHYLFVQVAEKIKNNRFLFTIDK